MIGAFWIFLFTVAVGVVLYVGELIWRRKNKVADSVDEPRREKADDAPAGGELDGVVSGDATDDVSGGECCGLHLVCEKDTLTPLSDKILYYDDEELDRFIGRAADSYTLDEVEEFRDVLMTLRPEDVAGWARSITQRRLELPPDVKDELLMLVNEQRNRNREKAS